MAKTKRKSPKALMEEKLRGAKSKVKEGTDELREGVEEHKGKADERSELEYRARNAALRALEALLGSKEEATRLEAARLLLEHTGDPLEKTSRLATAAIAG